MKNKWIKLLSVAAFALVTATATKATPITADAGWYGFCFGGVGSGATAGCQNDAAGTAGNTMTFSLSGPALLKVTDAFQVGDVFDVFVNSVLAFTTSTPGVGPDGTTDPDAAYGSGYFSAGSFLLAAGSYSVDIFAAASPFGGGGAYVEVESARVPLPGTLVLLGIGLACLGFARRKA